MSIAQEIMSAPDRTPKERRNMAELRDVCVDAGCIDWSRDVYTAHFRDGSALMCVLDEDLSPVEFLAIEPSGGD